MSSRATNAFDRLADYYDPLARLVYGDAIRLAQVHFLDTIPGDSKILILGGGTGWILDELFSRKPDCEVWYVESSTRMMEMAQRRSAGRRVHFVFETNPPIPRTDFDVILTFFFLDLFSITTLKKMISEILSVSKPSVIWLVADFVDREKWWQKQLLGIMYFFFRSMGPIEARRLPEWTPLFLSAGLKRIKDERFYAGFIESAVYELRS